MEISIENIGKEQDKYLKSISKDEELWLTEQKLGRLLDEYIYQDFTVVPQFKIDNYKVDFLIKEKNIIIEFQGYQHFTKTKIAYKDDRKFDKLASYGYTIIEIPYFIQLSSSINQHIFNYNQNLNFHNFPHGFIHPKATLPCDFCQLGLLKYNNILKCFPHEVKEQCESSIRKRSEIDKIPYYDFIY